MLFSTLYFCSKPYGLDHAGGQRPEKYNLHLRLILPHHELPTEKELLESSYPFSNPSEMDIVYALERCAAPVSDASSWGLCFIINELFVENSSLAVQHSKLNANFDLKCVKCNGCMLSDNHDLRVLDFINNMNARVKSRYVKKNSKRQVWKPTGKVFTNIGYIWRPTGRPNCPLSISVNDHVSKDYGLWEEYYMGNVYNFRVFYYVEGLGHNLFYVGQFCDSNLEVAFRQHTCYIRNLEGVDLLTGSRGDNLYTLSLEDMMVSSPICLLSKASKTKFWLWHRRLSHLNFGAINHLAKHGLVRGKSTKKPHKPKSEDTNQEKLYLLHMDMCGPMRVASVNGKKYILVIVDDYSLFTWVKCLRSKDEAPAFIINF
ncbi:retrovirus-related pol polyprotein from transposon TNT 1-94 [Tanacetum coccineum]